MSRTPGGDRGGTLGLLGMVGRSLGYLQVQGKPVVFLYGEICRGLTPEHWATVLGDAAHRAPPGVFAVGDGDAHGRPAAVGRLSTMDTPGHLGGPEGRTDAVTAAREQGWLFVPPVALARRLHGLSVETVVPGFDDRKPSATGPLAGPLLGRKAGALYRALWERAISDGRDWVLVNSFNKWHNGTEIEPSVEMGDKYLALTARRPTGSMRCLSKKFRGADRQEW